VPAFGYKAQLLDKEDAVILDPNVEVGNPIDTPMLDTATGRVDAPDGRPGGGRSDGDHRVEQPPKTAPSAMWCP
jgi:hypothetical protein